MNECVAVYVRVSTQEQAREGYSIGEQEERLKAYCKALKWHIYKVYNDAGYSGANTARPALQALLKDVKARKVSKVVVYKLDRLSRSQKDTLSLIEDAFLANKVDFVSMSENFDTSTPFGRAMIGILSVFAQLEREQIKERAMMGQAARAKKGLYHGSNKTAVGYRYEDGKLLIDDFEALQVRSIFEQYADGKGPFGIIRDLNESGMVHHYGKWTYNTFRRTLRNQIYIGMINYNGEVIPGQHEPIIDNKTFLECQRRLERDSERAKSQHQRTGKASSIFGGILHCAECGDKYFIKHMKTGGIPKRYYVCHSKIVGSKLTGVSCHNKTWQEDILNKLIIDEVKTFQLDESYNKQDTSEDERSEEIAALRLEIDRIDKQIARVMDLYAVEGIDLQAVSARLAAYNAQKENVQADIDRAEKEIALKPSRREALSLAAMVDNVVASGDLDRQREFFHTLINRIEVNGEDLTIFWNFD